MTTKIFTREELERLNWMANPTSFNEETCQFLKDVFASHEALDKKVGDLRSQVIMLKIEIEDHALDELNDLRDMEIRVLRAYRDDLKTKLHRAKEIIGARHAELSEIEQRFFDELQRIVS